MSKVLLIDRIECLWMEKVELEKKNEAVFC